MNGFVVFRLRPGQDLREEPGDRHLHIAISDKEGNVFGGHLKKGSVVEATAEVVIGNLEGVTFTRKPDPETGYDELVVEE